jgi:fucose permease
MLKYFLFFAGILTMCVPDEASLSHMAVQGVIGLLMMIAGAYLMIQEQEPQ